jgi:ATP-dependent Clp protease ATP-binding subunit ClpA
VIKSNIFSPEFINRFDGVVVYEPLSEDHLLEIARLQLKILSQSLIEKDIILEFDEEAIKKIAREGYDPAFGARPMKRIIEIYLGDLIGKAVLEGQIGPGDKIRVLAGSGKNEFKYQKLNS